MGKDFLKPELADFLQEECQRRGISLRRLSINAGLSAATVHNILRREYQPTVASLNQLADYLGVKRQYLWQLAGLLEDMDYGPDTEYSDARLKSCFARADKLPDPARDLIINAIRDVIAYLEAKAETSGQSPRQQRRPN